MIIGIAGTLGAGKGTVVAYLTSKGFAHYSSSTILGQILTERGIESTRENLSELANELMRQYEGGILHYSHELAKKNADTQYILESLHRVSEGEYIKKIGGVILGVDADVRVRYERTQARQEGKKDEVTYEEFLADSAREDEGKTGSGPNIKAVIKMADYVIENNTTIADLHTSIDDFLSTFKLVS